MTATAGATATLASIAGKQANPLKTMTRGESRVSLATKTGSAAHNSHSDASGSEKKLLAYDNAGVPTM